MNEGESAYCAQGFRGLIGDTLTLCRKDLRRPWQW